MQSEIGMTERMPTGLLGKKGELLVTNRLLRDYEVFFPYFDRGIDLVVKKKDEKKFLTIQCRTRDFQTHTKRNLIIKKADFEKMKVNIDFLVLVLYLGEGNARFIVFPIRWLGNIIERIRQRREVEKNYTILIKYKDERITYEPKGLDISREDLAYLNILMKEDGNN